jgi:hypothetical protein
MVLTVLTLFHVAISLIGIGSGFVVVYGLLTSKRFEGWTAIFLSTTVATSVTGFMFPFHRFLPSHAVGVVSLIVLAFAILARYRFQLSGGWRRTYAITAVVGLYLNVFVLIAQLFMKVPSLKELAPTQSEPPFQITQGVALVIFTTLAVRAAMKFHGDAARPAAGAA